MRRSQKPTALVQTPAPPGPTTEEPLGLGQQGKAAEAREKDATWEEKEPPRNSVKASQQLLDLSRLLNTRAPTRKGFVPKEAQSCAYKQVYGGKKETKLTTMNRFLKRDAQEVLQQKACCCPEDPRGIGRGVGGSDGVDPDPVQVSANVCVCILVFTKKV